MKVKRRCKERRYNERRYNGCIIFTLVFFLMIVLSLVSIIVSAEDYYNYDTGNTWQTDKPIKEGDNDVFDHETGYRQIEVQEVHPDGTVNYYDYSTGEFKQERLEEW